MSIEVIKHKTREPNVKEPREAPHYWGPSLEQCEFGPDYDVVFNFGNSRDARHFYEWWKSTGKCNFEKHSKTVEDLRLECQKKWLSERLGFEVLGVIETQKGDYND